MIFDIFENRIAAGAAGAGTFCPEPEPESEPPKSFTRSRSRSRNTSSEPEPEPTKNVTAPHPWFQDVSGDLAPSVVGVCIGVCVRVCNVFAAGCRFQPAASVRDWLRAASLQSLVLERHYDGLQLVRHAPSPVN